MHSVLETSIFSRRADALLTWKERAELISLLAFNPEVGDLIPDTGGVRKLRFGAGGRGKRGGFRVIYYVLDECLPLIAMLLYGKNEQSDLSPEEKTGARTIVATMKKQLVDNKKLAG